MKFKLYFLLITILLLGFSCGDDDDDGIVEVPEADRTEQQVIDNDSLVSFLQSHYVDESLLTNNPTILFNEIELVMWFRSENCGRPLEIHAEKQWL